jgi:hypothetical protein
MLTYEGAYRGAGQWDTGARSLERAALYLVKCHLQASNDPAGNVFVGQVRGQNSSHVYRSTCIIGAVLPAAYAAAMKVQLLLLVPDADELYCCSNNILYTFLYASSPHNMRCMSGLYG